MFWLHNRTIDRLRAEEDLRQIQVLAAVTSKDSYDSVVERLTKFLGRTVEFDEADKYELVIDPKTGRDVTFDHEGLKALKDSL
ncbi:tetrahydromethanopterin S-methyltransferase subunit G [Ochrobactrum sp. P20RRXII]|nr:hypothetical protein [Ochrobactrum sp. P20RRXII]NIH77429.1 tetrahydromethanopterin S-methyltransferase subunit G [Ochrobactrum sp. P20RRXII]